MLREWAGRGTPPADPYDPALVRSAPREIRHALAKALAEEETARTVAPSVSDSRSGTTSPLTTARSTMSCSARPDFSR